MKKPIYSLAEGINVYVDKGNPMAGSVEIPAGTLVFPFWNETYLTKERRAELNEAKGVYTGRKYPAMNFDDDDSHKGRDLVMCNIGKYWIPVERKNIREIY